MNIPFMMDELVNELKTATNSLQLLTPKGKIRAPQVVDGYLPAKNPKDQNEVEDFPYVIARYISDIDGEEGATAQVKVICGVFCEDEKQGWRDLLVLTDAIKTYFLANRFFGGCFSLEPPLKREFPEEQLAPEWWGWFNFIISIPSIQEVDKDVRKILDC